jgi:hypothetical protein
MLIGQSVYVPADSDPGVIYYGPWLPRQGDSGTAVLEILKESSPGWEVVYKVYTKNAEDSDAAASNIGGMTATTVGTHLGDFSGCKELIRVLYWCKGGGTARWLHLRSNPIQWQPN